MRNTNKKGFTIVELVIVVAVIAILAAVLIPTFSGVIKKAQYTADQKAEKDMNTALAIEMNPKNLDDAIDALIENGFNGKNLVPVSAGYSYVWSKADYKIYLVKTDAITADHINLAEGVKYIDVVADNVENLFEAISLGSEKITLNKDIEINKTLSIPANANVTLDLGGHTITSTYTVQSDGNKSNYVEVNGSLTITNGTIISRGVMVYGTLTINDEKVTIINNDRNGGSPIRVKSTGKVFISAGTYKSNEGDYKGTESDKYWESFPTDEPNVIDNNGGEVVISGGRFECTGSFPYAINNYNNGKLTISGGEFIGYRGVVAATNGTVEISGGKFTVEQTVNGRSHAVYSANANVSITGGEFSGLYAFCLEDDTEDTDYTGTITVSAGVKANDVVLDNALNLKDGADY